MSTSPRRLGKYELEKRLGQGGMAEVWKAFDTQLHRYVAIKMLHANFQNDPSFTERFQREARVIASLHHPNIVQIHDFQITPPSDSENPVAYMVMDYVEGQTLAEYIRSTSRMGKFPPAADVVRLFTSISLAVDYAHRSGMVHRDIKPANILLDKRNTAHNPMGEPILSDFGIAKLMGTTTAALSGTWLGTPLYVAPEQAMGRPGNERSDIYSLGAILYEIFTGVAPFQGDTPAAIMMQHLNSLPTTPALINPFIPPPLAVVILRCLAKDPAARFPSAASLTIAMAEALNMPAPEGLSQSTYPVDHANMPTFLTSQPPYGTDLPSSAPSWPQATSSPSLPSSPRATPQVALSPAYGHVSAPLPPDRQGSGSFPALPGSQTPQSSPTPATLVASGQFATTSVTPQIAAAHLFPQSPKQRRRLLIVCIALVVLALVGSGVTTFLLASHGPAPVATTNADHAFFISSGQVNEANNRGFTDELQLDLYHIHNPVLGNAYYGWLEGDTNNTMQAPVFLGKLPVVNGQIHYLYPGDANHTNLLAIMSRFLITEEPDSALHPTIPSPDTSTWRYVAQFPQPTGPMSNSQNMSGDMTEMGVLDHLRHLLVQAPELQKIGLSGGLDIWLLRNTEKLLEWTGSARDDFHTGQTPFMSRQVVRVLDYLDGLSPTLKRDAPGQPVQIAPLNNAEISLLDLDPTHQFPSLLYLLDIHLNALIQSPSATAEQRSFATRIDSAIKNVEAWLASLRSYALQLEPHLFQQALLAPANLAILNNMYNMALYAFAGRIDPTNGNVQEGVIQAHYNVQRLATLDIAPYQLH